MLPVLSGSTGFVVDGGALEAPSTRFIAITAAIGQKMNGMSYPTSFCFPGIG
jgi:hypothetical protein